MANPTQRHTKGVRNKRRMHIYLEARFLVICPKCGKKARPHTVCEHCGYYKGKEFLNVLKKLTKKEKKAREKEIKAHEHEEHAKPMNMEEMSKKQ